MTTLFFLLLTLYLTGHSATAARVCSVHSCYGVHTHTQTIDKARIHVLHNDDEYGCSYANTDR